jgi:hypothetical protein
MRSGLRDGGDDVGQLPDDGDLRGRRLGSGGGVNVGAGEVCEIALSAVRLRRDAEARGATAWQSSATVHAVCTWSGASVDGLPKSALRSQVSKGAVNGDATRISSSAAIALRSIGEQ